MEKDWTVAVWGVRGSGPVPAAEYLEYGGNTACMEVDCGGTAVVLDAGSGLLGLGESLVRRGVKRVDILISHLHLDHILGLATFPAMMDREMEVHIYGEGWNGVPLREWLRTLVGRPYWPLGLEELPARLQLHEIGPGQSFRLSDGVSVSTLRGAHPGGSLLYRLDGPGRSLIYTLDCEMTGDMPRQLARFAQGGSLLIWDANFAEADLRKGWGHSTWEQGIALRRAAGAERVLMTHFNQKYKDDFLREQESLAGRVDAACLFAREGMELKV